MQNRKSIIGSISHGTLNERDLLESFSDILEELSKANKRYSEFKDKIRESRQLLKKKNWNSEQQENASYLVNEDLFCSLSEFALPYFYFGNHPGDGSDFGFWLDSDTIENDFKGDGQLKVSDLSEVPKDYAGEILHINDHGNCTLYVKYRTSQKLHEIWAVV